MDKTVITAILIVAGVVAAVVIFNTIYPAVIQSSDAMTSRQRRIDERLNSQIEIIHAAPAGGYTDVALVWVKNIGSLRIAPVESCDVFFGPEGNFSRIPYGESDPGWVYEIENDTEWKPTATVKFTVELDYDLLAGERYFAKVVTPNGVADEYYFSK